MACILWSTHLHTCLDIRWNILTKLWPSPTYFDSCIRYLSQHHVAQMTQQEVWSTVQCALGQIAAHSSRQGWERLPMSGWGHWPTPQAVATTKFESQVTNFEPMITTKVGSTLNPAGENWGESISRLFEFFIKINPSWALKTYRPALYREAGNNQTLAPPATITARTTATYLSGEGKRYKNARTALQTRGTCRKTSTLRQSSHWYVLLKVFKIIIQTPITWQYGCYC